MRKPKTWTDAMKIKFTKNTIERLTCDAEKGRIFFRDTECRGLVIEVRSTGGKTYYLSYRDRRGSQRLFKLGNADDIPPASARRLCDEQRRLLLDGRDPIKEKAQTRTCLTYEEFFNDRYVPYVKGYKRSWETDVYYARTHILPFIGSVYLEEMTIKHVNDVMSVAAKRLAPTSIYRLFTILRYSLNLAVKWKVSGLQTSPTQEYSIRQPRCAREYFLNEVETKRLLLCINTCGNRMLRYIIPMLLLTGARLGEARNAKWDDIDIERRFWRVPLSKNGEQRFIPLGNSAIQLLKNMPRFKNCEYVFPNPQTLRPYGSLYHVWNRVRIKARLPHIRIHDMRHSFASFLINSGCGLYEIQKILGHKSIVMTQRYSHLNQTSLLRAVSLAEQYVDMSMKRWNRDAYEAMRLEDGKTIDGTAEEI